MLNRKAYYIPIVLSACLLIWGVSCDETLTESGNNAVTLNISLPADSHETGEVEGHTAALYLFESNADEAALYSQTASVTEASVNLTIDSVAAGEYLVLAIIDYDGETNTGLFEKGDLFWGALDVAVDGDLTINLDEDYLQRYHSVIIGVRGIPSGHTGEPLACALMGDGESYWNLRENLIMGAVTTLYNQTAILAPEPTNIEDTLNGETEWQNFQIESGDYDLFFLLDHDGSVDDYEDNDELNPYSEGDQFYAYDYAYNQSDPLDALPLFTAVFEPLEFSEISLTIDYTIPEDEYSELTGDTIRASIWEQLGDEYPVLEVEGILSNISDSIVLDGVPEGTYHVTVTIGDNSESDPESGGFLAWGAIGVEITDDASIAVPAEWWQWVQDMTIGISNIPGEYAGEMILIGLFAADGDYFDFQESDNFLASGMGYVYNTTALVTMHPTYDYEETEIIAPGTYKLMVQIDLNGQYDYYNNLELDSIDMFMPYETGDPYWTADVVYDTIGDTGNFVFLAADAFSNFLGISGTVTCPSWAEGGGDIYVLLFENSPFGDTSGLGPHTWDIISEPGIYAIPVMEGFEGYVGGVWDVTGNGLEGESEVDGGPDEGDYVGFYGSSIDSLYHIEALSSDVEDIDFTIDIPYDDSLDIGN